MLGFAGGVLMCATPKALDETIPQDLMDRGFGTSTNIIINLAVFAMMILAKNMPSSEKQLGETKFWMLIFGFCLPFQFLAIFLHVYVYKYDSVDFCVKKGDKEGASALFRSIYPSASSQ